MGLWVWSSGSFIAGMSCAYLFSKELNFSAQQSVYSQSKIIFVNCYKMCLLNLFNIPLGNAIEEATCDPCEFSPWAVRPCNSGNETFTIRTRKCLDPAARTRCVLIYVIPTFKNLKRK